MGPAGSGKSTVAADVAGKRGEKVALFLFDEHLGTMLARSKGVTIDPSTPLAEGLLTIQAIDPMEPSPGKFTHLVRTSVARSATLMVIDSLTGDTINYMADKVVHLRYYGHRGGDRRALSVFKRRAGPHERTKHAIEFSAEAMTIGPPMQKLSSVLKGAPVLASKQEHH